MNLAILRWCFLSTALLKTTKWREFHMVQQDVFLKILNIIYDHNAQCAFPTSTVHVPNGVDLLEHNKEGK